MRRLYIDCEMGVSGASLANALMSLTGKHEEYRDCLLKAGYPADLLCVKQDMGYGGSETDEMLFLDSNEADDAISFIDGKSAIGELNLPDGISAYMNQVLSLSELNSTDKFWKLPEIRCFMAETAVICMALAELKPDIIAVSAVDAGCGVLETAAGNDSIPSAFIMNLLKGFDLAKAHRGEKCTAGGALILKGLNPLSENRGNMHSPKYGSGSESDKGIVTSVFYGETEENNPIAELVCNLDDMTAEDISFAKERLGEAGALDVYTTRISMKKDREGIMLTVMCRMDQKMAMIKLIFQHTTTLGIREYESTRYRLFTSMREIQTPEGIVHVKDAAGYGVNRSKAEYNDLAKIARSECCSISEVRNTVCNMDKGEKNHD